MLLKSALTVLALVLAMYAALCAWLFVGQRGLVYYPQFTRIAASRTDFSLQRDGIVLRGWRVNPGQRDAVVYFGGNAESLEPMRARLAQWFPQRTAYLLAYRGYGASDGAPSEPALVADALALFDTVAEAHPGGRIAVIGRSLGTGVASQVAAERPVDRLVLITPFDSLSGVAAAHYPWMPVRWLLRERYESGRHLAGYRGPVLVVRAGRDDIVPARSTHRLVDALPVAPEILVLPDADHIDLDADPAFARTITRFVDGDARGAGPG